MTFTPFPKIPKSQLFLCGGAVRDSLLGIPIKDRDFVIITEYTFKELLRELNHIGEVLTFKEEFLSIRCRLNGEVCDITYPRSESGYFDGRHPTKVTALDRALDLVKVLTEDAKRRDFTINAMYMDDGGSIIDLFDGERDLKNHALYTVGEPSDRFSEDFLRILRGVRFSIKYKLDIPASVLKAMIYHAPRLINISSERVREELNKCLVLDGKATMDMLSKLNLFAVLDYHGLWFKLTNEKKPKRGDFNESNI
ncbi:MAG: hypothetical protein WC307_06655 [Candidatus Nanoarchaeia archaeon]|jgi:tRNA nucleotidyltransferase (CCA-adding enzyme)